MLKTLPLLSVLFSYSAFAWEDHGMLTYQALKDMPHLQTQIEIETIESFLIKEKNELKPLLYEIESYAVKKIPTYPPTPLNLYFKISIDPNELVKNFTAAIRINPNATYATYLQFFDFSKNPKVCLHPVSLKSISLLPNISTLARSPFCEFKSGDKVDVLDVISTATNEPDDYGTDIGVWSNNGTEFGKNYGFGEQPFGNPTLIFGSQAPFHMGFYFEDAAVYKLASFLKRTYPEYRILLYSQLARFAFERNHPYWGYRFLGRAIHYIQDLTQPYHTTPLPDVSFPRMLWANVLDMISISKPKNDLIQLVTNRHLALENYQFNLFRTLLKKHQDGHPVLKAIRDQSHDLAFYDNFRFSSIRNVVSKEAFLKAPSFDTVINRTLPGKFVNNPEYFFYTTDREINLREIMFGQKRENKTMENLIILTMQSLGTHTRKMVQWATNPRITRESFFN